MSKVVVGFLGTGAIAYAIACLTLWLGQTRLMFYPQPPPASTPAAVGLSYEDVWIPMGGDRLHGWWLPGSSAQAQTVLIFHGNASNVEDSLYHATPFLQAGLSALVIDYRGYGLSTGAFPTETSVYEDAEAAWHYLTQKRGIPPEHIVIFGNSIGGAIAIELAIRQPQAAGLIVQGTFTSMADMMDYVGYSRFFPKWLLHQPFNSIHKVPRITMPVLFIHGTDDTTVPVEMGQQLYALTPEPKYLRLFPGANHSNIAELASDDYNRLLQTWVRSLRLTPTITETSL